MKKLAFLGLLLLTCFYTVYAQTLPANFSNIKSSSISDSQLNQIIQQMTNAGYKPEQFFELAVARGMNPSEATIVQERINKKSNSLNNGNDSTTSNYNNGTTNNYSGRNYNSNDTLTADSTRRKTVKDSANANQNQLQMYGAEIFSNSNL